MFLFDYVIYPGLKVATIYFIYKLISIVIKRIKFARHYINFPYEPSHWILGDLIKVAPNFPFTDREVIADAVRKYVNRNHLQTNHRHDLSVIWMSWFPIIVASSHRSLEAIYQLETRKHHIYRFLGLREGLITSNGAKWKGRRKAIEPMLTTKQLTQFVPVIRSIVDTTVDSLCSVTGQPIVLSSYIHSLTMDAIFETGFKISADDFKEEKKIMADAIGLFEDALMVRIINPFYWSDWMFSKFQMGKQLDELSKQGDDYFNYFLDKRLGIKTTKKYSRVKMNNNLEKDNDEIFIDHPYRDMIDLMLKNKDSIDREGMVEEILTMIAAGHETIANAVSWLVFTLGNHPEIQDRIVEEIDRVIQSPEDIDDLGKIGQLVYMEQCIKESLRLFPPLPVVLRYLENDIQIGSRTLLKDSVVVMFILAAHHDPSVFPQPTKYDPERFAPHVVDSIPKYSFLPFGLGPRMCIGYRYAYIEMKIFLTQFLRRYRVKSMKSLEEVSFYIELISRPTCPLEVVLSPRD